MEKAYLNTSELSEYLNLKRSTIYSKVKSGDLPHYKVGRFQSEQVAALDRNNRPGSAE